MTAINGQKAPAHIVPSSIAIGSTGFISPDMILQYVANRLHSTDGQMQDLMKKQSGLEDDGRILTELANDLGQGNFQQMGALGDDVKKIDAAYDKAIKAAGGETTPLGSKLAETRARVAQSGVKGDLNLSNQEMKSALEEINRLQSDLSRGGEMMMMKLQSLASQRQQIVQFATNTIAGLGETAKAIAANTGK